MKLNNILGGIAQKALDEPGTIVQCMHSFCHQIKLGDCYEVQEKYLEKSLILKGVVIRPYSTHFRKTNK